MAVDRSAEALRARLLASLPPEVLAAIERLAGGPQALYAAGGAVRDALLGRALVDVDLVTEGDAIEAVTAAFPGLKATVHGRFRTASIEVAGTWIDLATARSEAYARPGALPDVAPADIDTDLRRRDFSVNAMALRLNGEAVLLDPCSGSADVDARHIRVLHDRSFQDDATRVMRAFRYAARLGFAIEPHTASLLTRDLPFLSTIGGERLRRELEITLSEATTGAALAAGNDRGALRAIYPSLAWNEEYAVALDGDAPRIPTGLALLAAHATSEDAAAIIDRLRLTREQADAVRGISAMRAVEPMLERPDAKPSGVVVLLDRYPLPAVAAFAASTGAPVAAQLAERYLREWRHEKPILSGLDVQAMGVPAGPQIRKALQLIRAARLDGWAQDRGDEQALVLRFAKSIRDSSVMRGAINFDPDGPGRN